MTRPQRTRSRGRGRKLAVVLPVVLACAAAVSVGAAAYSREGTHDSATNKAAHAEANAPVAAEPASSPPPLSDDAHIPTAEVDVVSAPVTGDAPVPASGPVESVSLTPDSSGAYKEIKIEIGKMGVTYDETGISQTSLPLKVTNTDSKVRSFDVTVAAQDDEHVLITKDTGTATNLQPGQSAEVRVLDLVNNAFAEKLKTATFAITGVFAY